MIVSLMIGNTNYSDDVSNIKFSPEVNLTCTELPVGQISFNLHTNDTIVLGSRAVVYMINQSNAYAAYWITSAVRNGDMVSVVAKSVFYILDTIELEEEMYEEYSVTSLTLDIFYKVIGHFPGATVYYIDPSLMSMEVSGYVPKQSARDRLLWLCLAIGAYVDTSFSTTFCRILPVSSVTNNSITVPLEDVYYRPKITETDVVTEIKITTYSYTRGIPTATDKWVDVRGTYYLETTQEYTLRNPDVPVTALDNPVVIDSVKIMNADNVSTILSLLALQYFKNVEVEAEFVHKRMNNYDFGSTYHVPISEDTYVYGYIKSMDFTFGSLKNKVKVLIKQIGQEHIDKITIRMMHNNYLIKSNVLYFPTGVTYSVQNPYLSKKRNNHRYIYIPDNDYATGIVSDGLVDTEQYGIALDFFNTVLHTISVDSATYDNESGVLTIG